MVTAFSRAEHVIGLGSNLGDRLDTLRAATLRLASFSDLLAVSAVYASDAVGAPGPRFLNAALRVRSELEPRELLEALLATERFFGRERRERWGPRTLDLDWLFSTNGLVLDEPGLQVPHPRLTERTFALGPLLDVAPDARDPSTEQRYSDLFLRLGGPKIERVTEPAGLVDLREIIALGSRPALG
jgi:2-amino-4-hydroxy-6-hydroxymethyldihydropteridine diphosphokinase